MVMATAPINENNGEAMTRNGENDSVMKSGINDIN